MSRLNARLFNTGAGGNWNENEAFSIRRWKKKRKKEKGLAEIVSWFCRDWSTLTRLKKSSYATSWVGGCSRRRYIRFHRSWATCARQNLKGEESRRLVSSLVILGFLFLLSTKNGGHENFSMRKCHARRARETMHARLRARDIKAWVVKNRIRPAFRDRARSMVFFSFPSTLPFL